MSDPQANLGFDLHLLGNLLRQNDRANGSDLRTTQRASTGGTDLDTLKDRDNLRQALLIRFLTRLGEMSNLGHPDYGCRLYTLIGELNTETNRNRAKLFTLEALAAEPRIEEILTVSVTAGPRDTVNIQVSVRAIGDNTPLNLVFPFFLGGPQ